MIKKKTIITILCTVHFCELKFSLYNGIENDDYIKGESQKRRIYKTRQEVQSGRWRVL